MRNSDEKSGVVAVTRSGLGDWFLFETFEEADQHPLVQYGDVICRGPEWIMSQWTWLELPDLLDRIGGAEYRSEVLVSIRESASRGVALERHLPQMWVRMLQMSSPPPTDPEEILTLIRRDRQLSIKERKMTDTTTNAPKAGDKNDKPKASGTRATYQPDQKVQMLADKEGKKYGKDHNPKREGSSSAQRFALYKDGMTVKDFLDAGGTMADLKHDASRNFIKVA